LHLVGFDFFERVATMTPPLMKRIILLCVAALLAGVMLRSIGQPTQSSSSRGVGVQFKGFTNDSVFGAAAIFSLHCGMGGSVSDMKLAIEMKTDQGWVVGVAPVKCGLGSFLFPTDSHSSVSIAGSLRSLPFVVAVPAGNSIWRLRVTGEKTPPTAGNAVLGHLLALVFCNGKFSVVSPEIGN
jgi:hypothetical protein